MVAKRIKLLKFKFQMHVHIESIHIIHCTVHDVIQFDARFFYLNMWDSHDVSMCNVHACVFLSIFFFYLLILWSSAISLLMNINAGETNSYLTKPTTTTVTAAIVWRNKISKCIEWMSDCGVVYYTLCYRKRECKN